MVVTSRCLRSLLLASVVASSAATSSHQMELDAKLKMINPNPESFADLLQLKQQMKQKDLFDTQEFNMTATNENLTLPSTEHTLSLLKQEDYAASSNLVKLMLLQEDEVLHIPNTNGEHDAIFGTCEEEFIDSSIPVKIFVYLQMCPTAQESLNLQGWSVGLKSFLSSHYEVSSSVEFVLETSTCSTPLSNNPSAVAFDTSGSSSNTINVAINFFNGGSANIAHVQAIKLAQEAASISQSFSFFVCSEQNLCIPSYDENYQYLSSLSEVVAYSQLKIVQRLACPNVHNSVPIEYYYGNIAKCACRCPAGFELVTLDNGATHECVRKTSECQCAWINQCYTYSVSSDFATANTCEIRNWYGLNQLVPIPFPNDNYVGFAPNPSDLADGTTTSGVGPRVTLTVNSQSVDYSWQYFQEHRLAIFNGIQINKVGVYDLSLQLYDYNPIPTECSTTLVVLDNQRPFSTATCPSGQTITEPSLGEENAAYYSASNYDAAVTLFNSYKTWVNSRANDPCGDHTDSNACRLASYEQYSIGMETQIYSDPESGLANPEEYFQITPEDITKLEWPLNIQSPAPGAPANCKKCGDLWHVFGELVYPYECFETPGLEAECKNGEACSVRQCLVANGTTFFAADSAIKADMAQSTEALLADAFADVGYNSIYQIHKNLPAGCTASYDTPECQLSSHVRDLITVSQDWAAPYVQSEVFNNQGDLDYLLTWRYRINDETNWHSLTEEFFPASFSQFRSVITIEAWSTCGMVDTFTYEVYLHLHSEINVCEAFAQNSFYQSSQYHPMMKHENSNWCNHPESNFAEMTFDYHPGRAFADAQAEADNGLTYSFQRLRCFATMDDDHNSSTSTSTATNAALVVPWYSLPDRFLQRYAVTLPQAPTEPIVALTWSCEFEYTSFDGTLYSTNCSNQMIFCDCDKAAFDCPWGKCQLTCPATKARPNHVCQGTSLKLNQDTRATEVLSDDVDCCTECGTSTTCESIFPGIESNTIKTCTIHGLVVPENAGGEMVLPHSHPSAPMQLLLESETTNLEKQTMIATSSVVMGVVVIATVIGMLLIRQHRRTLSDGDDENQSLNYQLLM